MDAEFIAGLKKHIDDKAGQVRAQYITIAPGQEATYMMKARQARVLVASGFTSEILGLMEAEMLATGESIELACQRVLDEEAKWEYIAGAVEKVRRPAKVLIDRAASEEEAQAIHDEAIRHFAAVIS